MPHVAVTIQYERERRDLALPMEIQVRHLAEGVAQVFKLPKKHGRGFSLGVWTENGSRPLSPNASLADLGVLHGATLVLARQHIEDAPPVTEARLQTEQGISYSLTSKITLLGRSDAKSGIFVEIDLAALASDPKAISRRHAQIEQEGDRFYLTDLGSVNGTRINGQRIPPNEKKPVWDGDLIEFGRSAVRMTFSGGGGKK